MRQRSQQGFGIEVGNTGCVGGPWMQQNRVGRAEGRDSNEAREAGGALVGGQGQAGGLGRKPGHQPWTQAGSEQMSVGLGLLVPRSQPCPTYRSATREPRTQGSRRGSSKESLAARGGGAGGGQAQLPGASPLVPPPSPLFPALCVSLLLHL